MAVNWEGSQARADAEPRMREPVSRKVQCCWCGELVDDYEQDYGTGVSICIKCLEEEEEDEESDENNQADG